MLIWHELKEDDVILLFLSQESLELCLLRQHRLMERWLYALSLWNYGAIVSPCSENPWHRRPNYLKARLVVRDHGGVQDLEGSGKHVLLLPEFLCLLWNLRFSESFTV